MANYILIHGAWHGAWCWHKVKAFLEEHGDRVLTPDLPGHGDDPAGADSATLESYVARVEETLAACDEPAVLVGHSMAGAVISAAAEKTPEMVERLVFVTAYVPQDGESINDLARMNLASALRGNLEFTDDGATASVRDQVIREAFYHDCSDEDVEFATHRLRPQNPAVFTAPVRLTAERYGTLPRQFIECIEDQAIHIALQRWMARRAGCLVNTLNTSHSPFFSAPAALAAQIARIGIKDDT